jgi:cytochrome c oxidase accessory protein FixG
VSREGPQLDRLYSIRADGSRRFLHPSDVRGRFILRRRLVFAALLAVYLALPLVRVGGHPAVHLDIAARRFHLFGAAFNAVDVWMIAFALTAFVFGLLFMTAWLGRAWCGWACPQTVFLEGIYRVIERIAEGPGEKRLRLDRAPWSANKLARKVAKHAGFVLASLFLSHVTISLFVSGRSLLEMMRHDPREQWEAFVWAMALAALLYFNFAWFREQFCIVVCPYGRLQSSLVDRDSLVVGYDAARGEPRGKAKQEGVGDCVDCRRCVVVCPTGIDIRNGLQMECLACAQCIDACDEIMDKLGRPRGLVRYDSQAGLEGQRRTARRPRLYAYGGLFAAAALALVISTRERVPFDAVLVRAAGSPYVVDDQTIRNQFAIHLVNKSAAVARFRIVTPTGVADFALPQATVELQPLESVRMPLFVSVARQQFHAAFPLQLAVQMNGAIERRVEARFLGPTSALR